MSNTDKVSNVNQTGKAIVYTHPGDTDWTFQEDAFKNSQSDGFVLHHSDGDGTNIPIFNMRTMTLKQYKAFANWLLACVEDLES